MIDNKLESIEVIDLNVTLGKEKVLRGVNLNISSGELFALVGQNGAGKSTLFKTILGETTYNGVVSFKFHGESRKVKIGYVPQKLDFDITTPISVLDFFGSFLAKRPICLNIKKSIRKKVYEYLEVINCGSLIDKKLGHLSGGELQRVLLSLAIYNNPDILLLDEPVSGIDINGLKIFYDIVLELKKKYNLIVILITHDLKMVKNKADKVALLNNGIIEVYGTPEQVFNNFNFNKILGVL